MNKRSTSTSTSTPSSRVKLSLRRASLRELTSADLTSVAGGTFSRVNDNTGCQEHMDPR
jgi:hypothetical protein